MKTTATAISVALFFYFTGVSILSAQINYGIDINRKYRLEAISNGKTLEVEDGSPSKGKRIQQNRGFTRNGDADGFGQEWFFLPAGVRDGHNLVRILNNGFLAYLTENSGSGCAKPELQAAMGKADNQLWEILPSSGFQVIVIRSFTSQMVLEAPSSSKDGEEMQLSEYNSAEKRQQFRYSASTPSMLPSALSYTNVFLKPAFSSDKVLDVSACNTASGTLLDIWNRTANNVCQQFKISISSGLGYFIAPVLVPNNRLQVAAANGIGANVTHSAPSNHQSQEWMIFKLEREADRFVIINKFSGLCIEVLQNNATSGANVGQGIFNNQGNQKWIIER
ncbi:MAG: RICIN domain-containing protein [Lewinellaceae bacterium]|nr:RICIN domain-containing protein [Lewinellaceae bacterium]